MLIPNPASIMYSVYQKSISIPYLACSQNASFLSSSTEIAAI